MDGTSLDIKSTHIEMLQRLFPQAVDEGVVNWEKLKLLLGENGEISDERYVLNWAGKIEAFRAIQTPTTATLKPAPEQSIDFDATQNVFIEGENLEVLKVLQKSYYGKVKMIYIDPPYNTGNDSFIYPDKFSESKEDYLRRIGEKDAEGNLTREGLFRKNSRDNGRLHSNWLSMMYPRLFLARNLLCDDGVIFTSIDDNEVHNLRLMMNEIFGEENRVESFIWKKSYGGGAKEKYAVTQHEYVLLFAKDIDAIKELWLPPDPQAEKRYYKYRDEKYDVRGPYRIKPLEATKSMDRRDNLVFPIVSEGGDEIWPKRQWWWSKERIEMAQRNNELVFTKSGDNISVSYKQYLKDESGTVRGSKPFSIIDGIYTQKGTSDLLAMFEGGSPFQFPKPFELIKKLLAIGTDNHSEHIVLDFFAGSGTTAHAVYELNKDDGGNRKFILVQLPERTEEDSVAFTAGYATIADICKERIRRVSKKIRVEVETQPELFKDKPLDLGFKVFRLEQSNFKSWRTDTMENEKELTSQMEVFTDPVHAKESEQRSWNMVWELLIKFGYELTTPVERVEFEGVPVYKVAGGELLLFLDAVSQDALTTALDWFNRRAPNTPKRALALDRLFTGNDQLKTNTVLQMKDAGVDWRTV